jgi:putative protease
MSVTMRVGERANLTATDDGGHRVEVLSDMPVQQARTLPLGEARLAEQLRKTGDSPWNPILGKMEIDDGATLPVSAINAMRRQALDSLRDMRVASARNA